MAIERGGISTPLGLDLDPFKKGLKQAEKLAAGFNSKMQKFVSGKIWDTASFAAGMKASKKEMSAFTDQVIKAREEYQDMINLKDSLKKSGLWDSIGEQAQAAVQKSVDVAEEAKKAYDRTFKHMRRGQAVRGLFGGLKKIFTGIGGLFAGFRRGTVRAGNDFGRFLRQLVGIGSVALLVRKAYAMMKDGLGNLVKADSKTAASVNQLKGAFTSLKNALASIAAPIINAIAPVLVKIIGLFTKAANAVAMFVAALTGQKAVVVATEGISDGVSGIGDSASGANDSAKELQRTLMGFDKINKLDGLKDAGSSGGSGGGAGAGTGFETVPVTSLTSEWADKFRESWEKADFYWLGELLANKLNNALANIPWDKIQDGARKLAKSLATFLNGFIENADWNLVGETIAQGLNTAIYFAQTFVKTFNWAALGTAIADTINGFVKKTDWSALGDTIGSAIYGLLTAVNNFLKKTDWSSIGSAIVETITSIDWVKLFTGALELVGNIATAIFDTLSGAISTAKDRLKKWIDSGKIWDDLFEIGKAAVDLTVNLVKGAWGILTDLVGAVYEVGISLIKSAWSKISYFLFGDGKTEGEETVGLRLRLINKIKELLFGNGKTEGEEDVKIGLLPAFGNGVKTVAGWLDSLGKDGVTRNVGLAKNFGKNIGTVASWIDSLGKGGVTRNVGLTKTSAWLGHGVQWWIDNVADPKKYTVWRTVGLTKISTWLKHSVAWWIDNVADPKKSGVSRGVGLWRNFGRGIGSVWSFINSFGTSGVSRGVGLYKDWGNYSTVAAWVTSKFLGGTVSIGVELFKWGWSSIRSFFGLSKGGFDTGHGFRMFPKFAQGGFVKRYAQGGLPDGSQLFWAREAGPELVGTIGGHTAVMNNDQIVSSVANGVARAISGIRFRMNATPQLVLDKDVLKNTETVQTDNSDIVALLRILIEEVRNKDFKAELDGRQISKSTIDYINNETRRTGMTPILI